MKNETAPAAAQRHRLPEKNNAGTEVRPSRLRRPQTAQRANQQPPQAAKRSAKPAPGHRATIREKEEVRARSRLVQQPADVQRQRARTRENRERASYARQQQQQQPRPASRSAAAGAKKAEVECRRLLEASTATCFYMVRNWHRSGGFRVVADASSSLSLSASV